MKKQSTSISEKIFNFIFIFLSSAGLGYALVNHFLLGKPNKEFFLIMFCLFLASVASWQRKKFSKYDFKEFHSSKKTINRKIINQFELKPIN